MTVINKMNKNYKRSQKGRSMVEMLGVLAIVGVLSVGGVYGYGVAIKKHKANQLLHEASMLATTVSAQIMSGQKPTDLTDFGTGNNITLDKNSIEGQTTFQLIVSDVDEAVCKQLQSMNGGMVRKIECGTANADGKTTAILSFNNNLSNDKLSSEYTTPEECKDAAKIWSNGSCMDACPTGYTACGSACCADGTECVDGQCRGCIAEVDEWGNQTGNVNCDTACAEGDTTYCAKFSYDGENDICEEYACCSGKFLAPDMPTNWAYVEDTGHCCESGTPYCISYNYNCVFGYECCPEGNVVLTYTTMDFVGGVHASACCNPGDNVYCNEPYDWDSGQCQFASCCPAGYKYENGEIYGGKGACCKPEQEIYCATMLATYEQAESWINNSFPGESYYPGDYVGICAEKECCDPGKYVEATAKNNGICCDGKESTWGVNGTGEPYVEYEYEDGYKQYNCCNGTVIKGENGEPDTCQG